MVGTGEGAVVIALVGAGEGAGDGACEGAANTAAAVPMRSDTVTRGRPASPPPRQETVEADTQATDAHCDAMTASREASVGGKRPRSMAPGREKAAAETTGAAGRRHSLFWGKGRGRAEDRRGKVLVQP